MKQPAGQATSKRLTEGLIVNGTNFVDIYRLLRADLMEEFIHGEFW